MSQSEPKNAETHPKPRCPICQTNMISVERIWETEPRFECVPCGYVAQAAA